MKNLNDLLLGASLGTVLAGTSIIDNPNLQIATEEEAEAFIECYGYDLRIDQQEIESLRLEAIRFIHEVLLASQCPIPENILHTQDIRKLLIWASNKKSSAKSLWSCSILRVMHTLAHCNSFFNQHYHREIREQIITRFQKHVSGTEGNQFLGDIALVDFHSRPQKSRESVVIKLLHKAENVTADIFDWVGVRFVTKFRFDAIQVLSFLREKNVVMFANVKPSRSRNTLIDLQWLNQNWEQYSEQQLRSKMQKLNLPQEQGSPVYNFHTTSHYHALQFTCRQRIKLTDATGQRISFFFPYEVQIMDEVSFNESRMGDASHQKYKQRQLEAVKMRVLGPLYQRLF